MQLMPATATLDREEDRPALHAGADRRPRHQPAPRQRLPEARPRRLRRLAGDGRGGLQRRPGPAAQVARGPGPRAAVWAENIPFPETRDYVKKVLSQQHLLRRAARRPGHDAARAPRPHDRPARSERAAARQGPALRRPRGLGENRRSPAPLGAMPHHVLKFLILGGTGFVGRSVCEKLVERSGGADGRIRVADAAAPRARHLQLLPTVEIAGGDVHDDATLARMLRDTDAVINLVAILHGSEAEFERVHVRLPRAPRARPARRAGVRRVIHVSALGAAADAPSRYLRSKARGEAALRAAGARPDGAAPVGDLRRARPLPEPVRRAAVGLPGACRWPARRRASSRSGSTTSPPRSRAASTTRDDRPDDRMLRPARLHAARAGRSWPAAGRARARPVLALPAALGRLQALVMELLPGKPLMSRDNLDSMQRRQRRQRQAARASTASASSRRRSRAIAPRYLGHVSGEARLEAWRAARGAADAAAIAPRAGRRCAGRIAAVRIEHRPTAPIRPSIRRRERRNRRMQLYIGNKNYSSWSMRAWLLMKQAGIAFDGGQAALRLGRRARRSRRRCSRWRRPGACRCWSTTASRSGTRWRSPSTWPSISRQAALAARPQAARAGAQPLRRDALGLSARCATAAR